MKVFLKTVLLVLSCAAASSNAVAAFGSDLAPKGASGGLNEGRLKYLFVANNQGGFVIVESRGAQTGSPPTCSQPNRYAFSLSDAGGYAYLAVIQGAIARKQAVTLSGSGVCTISGNREDLKSIDFVVPEN